MSFTRTGGLAVLMALAVSVSGCSTVRGVVDRINPFDGDDEEANQAVATQGQRIAIIAFDQKVAAADVLKGQDFFLPPATPIGDWPLPGGTPEQSIEHVQAADALQVAWRRGFGEGSGREEHVIAPPVMADGKVFVMDGRSNVAAIDVVSGREVWKVELPARYRRDRHAFGGGMAYADGKLYVSSGNRYVAQLDASNGGMGWRRETASPIHAAPTVAGGRVFVVSTDNELLAFNAATGTEDWNYQALVEPARLLRASSPAVSGDTVVAAFASGEVIALRAANGNDLWNQPLSRSSRINALSEIRDIAGRPVIYKGDVYAASHSGVFAAIDLRTGQPRWTLPVASITTPWPSGDVVYTVSQAGEVICVSRENGQVYWIRDLNQDFQQGEERKGWGIGSFRIGGRSAKLKPLWTSPILASGRLLVASSTGQLVALNPKTGETLGGASIGSSVIVGPIAANGTVYLVTDEAELVAIR
jgi:outer membrane protein assembly factor BamB